MPKKERKLLGERMRKSEAPAGFKNKPLLSALPLSEGSADILNNIIDIYIYMCLIHIQVYTLSTPVSQCVHDTCSMYIKIHKYVIVHTFRLYNLQPDLSRISPSQAVQLSGAASSVRTEERFFANQLIYTLEILTWKPQEWMWMEDVFLN